MDVLNTCAKYLNISPKDIEAIDGETESDNDSRSCWETMTSCFKRNRPEHPYIELESQCEY